jgi:phosphohistidine phosphatase
LRIILMRHGEAGDSDPRRWPDDRDRPLTEAGHAEHRAVAAALRHMGVTFDRLLSSPLVRARQTARITADAYGGREVELTEALGDRATPEALLTQLGPLARDHDAVLCVGHEPFLSAIAAVLISGSGRARIEMRKSGVIAVECAGAPAPGTCTLLFHFRPDELTRLSGPTRS